MGMRCSRVGCSGHAVASFCFDGRAALVWLDPLDPERGTGAGVLCARHADSLTPPRGWHLQDRRTRAPRLWDDRPPVRVATVEAGPEPEPVIIDPLIDETVEAVLAAPAAHLDPLPFDEAVPISAESAARLSAEPAARLSADRAPSDVDALLDARTPMLARAFAAAGSVPERASGSVPERASGSMPERQPSET